MYRCTHSRRQRPQPFWPRKNRDAVRLRPGVGLRKIIIFFLLQETLNQTLAKAVFISGSPLAMVEHPLWVDFFKKLRPSYKLPSRFRMATTYLEAQYTEMKEEVNKALQDTKHLHMQCDGWSNIRNESIINFVISKPEPYFVDFKMTKSERHNADYLAELIGSVITNYGPEKFLVVIADNAANMKAALSLVKEKYPHIVPLGCIAHLLHLLCSDILGCQTVKTFFAEVTGIVKTIKHSHILQAIFDEIASEKRFKDRISLKLPGKTRWGSHLFCLQSLQSNKVVLQTLAVSEKAELEPSMKRRLLDDGVFWTRIEKLINLLEPIVHLITAIESNEPQIHKVVRKLDDLEKIIALNLVASPLQQAEEKKITAKFKERKDFGIGDIHLAAFLLDPNMQGSSLDSTQLLDAMGFICECAQNMNLDVMKVRESLADYRDKEGLFSRKFIWEGVGVGKDKEKTIRPLLWWRGLRGTCDLADVAIRILSAPVTSAATERTFSTFSWMHSKKRNRLSSERAAKLTYLAYNWKLMTSTPKEGSLSQTTSTDGRINKDGPDEEKGDDEVLQDESHEDENCEEEKEEEEDNDDNGEDDDEYQMDMDVNDSESE